MPIFDGSISPLVPVLRDNTWLTVHVLTIMLGYANKGHTGFVGHSYLGRWVNLGSGTTTSNLKNTYGTVALWTPQGTRDTGGLLSQAVEVLDAHLASLALRVGPEVDILSDSSVLEEEEGDSPLVAKVLVTADRDIRLLNPEALIGELEERING